MTNSPEVVIAGTVVIAATPIGNVADASARLRDLLTEADVIAAEDTRRLLDLARRLGIKISAPVVPLHEHNEHLQAPKLIERAKQGAMILAVTDAGMPAVSDPGYRLVQAAVAANVDVKVVPGPSAVLTALAVSGLATDRFCFEGFLPRKSGEQIRRLQDLVEETRTMIFFESPRRLQKTLEHMVDVFGSARPGAVCREITKVHEEVRRGSLSDLASWANSREVLGEIVLVVAGNDAPCRTTVAAEAARVLALADQGLRLKAAASMVAEQTGLSARELYQAALEHRSRVEDN